jgi:hypothetical protein
LGFVPASAGGPSQLKGYSLAKSPNEVIIAKGINQYFVDDDTPTGTVKHDDVTLAMKLTVKDGGVIINARILDKAAGNAVLWERTVVDTPAADVMAAGNDSPAAPWIESGNLCLYLYANYHASTPEDPYLAAYDNAEAYVTETTVLDNFNDNQKGDWTDFTFVPGVGIPVEANGQFGFTLPAAVLNQVKRGLFAASTKTSRTFEIVEGERIEFSVDVIQGGEKDSFAVLSFIPSSSSGPGQLKGYSLAKSTTDVLIVKGINQYFVADAGEAAHLKQNNITLVLSLTGKDGNVVINARALDKDANNALLWEKTVVDTPAADVMADGTDNPAAPFFGAGNFVLYLYADYDAGAVEDPYTAIFDNAVVSAPPVAANTAPIISDTLPADFANFLPATTQISFKVTDDKAILEDKLSVVLNGTTYTKANGLSITGSGTTRTVTLGGLAENTSYTAVLRAEDAEAEVTTKTYYFDTFLAGNLAIEIEDYNYGGGQFIDNPAPTSENNSQANSYSMRAGLPEVDYHDTRTSPNGTDTAYRPEDPVRMAHTRDHVRAKYTAAGGAAAEVYDYDLGDIAADEWLNFTRTFPAGSYQVYLRQALANMPNAESVLEQVTSDPAQPDQATKVLGSFLGTLTGFQYRNFPLTDGTGLNKVTLRLSGKTTLRLRQVTPDPGDGMRLQTYMMFVPVADAGVQRATIASVTPASGTVIETVTPAITVVIQNRDTTVNTGTIKLHLNGVQVPATVISEGTGATVRYAIAPLPASGVTNRAVVSFKDNQDVEVTTAWDFVVSYKSLDPALRVAGTGKTRGINVRVAQQVPGGATENSLAFAESLLAPGTTREKSIDTNVVDQVINYSQNDPGSAEGYFPDDLTIPGIDPAASTDDIAMEATAYLDLPAGPYRFGARCDDGYKVQVVADFDQRGTAPLSFHNGGPADETYDFVVSQSGLYRFRMVWYERGGGANVEWFSTNFATDPARTLINDPAVAGSVKAYASVDAPIVPEIVSVRMVAGGKLRIEWTNGGTLQSTPTLSGGAWTDVPGASPLTIDAPATGNAFYRVKK